ncbi:MAG: RNA polymerase sigma-70 factor [Bacteroidetes bacterium]|nr:RNA polymerase sigma-70 factor [Bacteroidota bacterium]
MFDIFFTHLCQFAYSIVKSREAATEVTDDVFINIWHNKEKLTSIDNLTVYLYKATKNTALNYISRKAQLNIHDSFDDMIIDLHVDNCPEELFISNEMLKIINVSINALPSRCKMIFKLVREDGLKYKEVAEILNLSVKTVDAQMVIAVNRIREAMKTHINIPTSKKFQKK